MTPDEEQCRDVYANFGVAVYFAQCFEKTVCNLLLFHRVVDQGDVTLENVDELERLIHKKTLGMLLKELKLNVTFNDSKNTDDFDKALEKRNFLLHHYFWERTVQTMSSNGRVQILAELDELRVLFQTADGIAKTLVAAARKAAGISPEMVQSELGQMQQEAGKL